jgi:NAD(P)-dependent dehydrogenase (short-subunit alcohol dehydrogenase family)
MSEVRYDFHGKSALVTGGASGIGRAVALALRASGCRVIVASLEGAGFKACKASAEFSDIHLVECDITSEADVERLFSGVDELDILIQCAGIISRIEEFRPEVFARVIDTNLTAAMRLASRARPALAVRSGCIVNTASMLSFFGGGLVPGYSASKGGIVQLTKSLAIAWAAERIRVNAVAPGWIATGFTQALQDDEARSLSILERTPMRRWGTVEDLVGPILFLCSSAAAFVTGAVLTVDGGYSAY